MQNNTSAVLISGGEIINVVRNALSKIDPRLVEHGERVAFIAKRIYEELDDKGEFVFPKLFVLCVLHDIGAYKTEEIDDMVRFETEKPISHSLYGYLFLKHLTHLSDYAEALLYHHTDYSVMLTKNCAYAPYAEMIHLADRADILLHTSERKLSCLKTMSGKQFNPLFVNAFFKANEGDRIQTAISSGSFLGEIRDTAQSFDVSEEEIMDYLRLVVYAIDFRSPYTVTHTADTTIISVETGKIMGLSEAELRSLYLGAYLHDIGKIAIPQSLLEKPDKLTTLEYDLMKLHVDEGEKILRGVISEEICNIALRHHEKIDGSGYPLGLTDKELTLSQQIVAVADIVSALSGRRSYKEPFPKDKVIGILTELKKDGKLSPDVVDAICDNYDYILEQTAKSHYPIKLLYDNLIREYGELSAKS